MSSISNANKTEILYNKNLGAVTALPNGTIAQQPGVNASAKIIPQLQIFNQNIPSVAPSDMVRDTNFNITVNPSSSGLTAERWYSASSPWIVNYRNYQLTTVQFQLSFNGLRNGVNIISQTIPYNYDPNLSYAVTVRLYSGGSFQNITSDSNVMPWYYDKDAGYITFYGSPSNMSSYLTFNPIMTFWRYEGTFGLSSSSGSTGTAGATGPAGPAGPTGPAGAGSTGAGATGPTGPAGAGGTGPTGPAGATGFTGPAGVASMTGATGPIGPAGPTGFTGPAGVASMTGATGETGPQGIQGVQGI